MATFEQALIHMKYGKRASLVKAYPDGKKCNFIFFIEDSKIMYLKDGLVLANREHTFKDSMILSNEWKLL